MQLHIALTNNRIQYPTVPNAYADIPFVLNIVKKSSPEVWTEFNDKILRKEAK